MCVWGEGEVGDLGTRSGGSPRLWGSGVGDGVEGTKTLGPMLVFGPDIFLGAGAGLGRAFPPHEKPP